jgi:DNA-binding CsgD family transcriptional regulator
VVRVIGAGRLRGDALRLLGEVRYHENSFPEAVRLLEEALVHEAGVPSVCAEIELNLTYATVSAADFAGIDEHAHRALIHAEESGEHGLVAEALAVVSIADFLRGRGHDRVRVQRALELEDIHRQVAVEIRPTLIAGLLSLYVGELDRSLEILERLRWQFLNSGEETDLAYVLCQMTWAECMKGDLADAATYADEAIEIAERMGSDAVRCGAYAYAALAAGYAGRAALTQERAAQVSVLAEETGFGLAMLWSQWGLAVLALSQAQWQAVDAAVGPFTALVERDGIEEPIRAPYLADEIEALIALEQLDRADRLTTLLDEAGRRLERQWVVAAAGRCRALWLAATGDMDRAWQRAEVAIGLSEGLEHRLELARTLLVAGEIQRRRRRKRAAGALLMRSLDLFEQAGARLWADKARKSVARTGIERRAVNELSNAEQRVAELAASGMTNREVAAALFMSPKTVEANLARAYRKLGIRSRAELGARVTGETGDDAKD